MNKIIEICELGTPKSIIQRENEPISEIIDTDILIEELNKQLILSGVVKSVSCGECNNTGYIIAENGDVGEDCHKCN